MAVDIAVPTHAPVGAIEASRIVAVVLLVLYHVIGVGTEGGLQVSGMHPARLFADFFVDLRMPLFAFIAGHVYALRPVAPAALQAFLAGKFRRLAVPGAVAITLFMLASLLLQSRFAPDEGWWQNYVRPYAHFWFLQAILLIFVIFGSFDVLSRGRFTTVVLSLSVMWYLSGIRLPTSLMSANHATYLLPYFLVGVLTGRHRQMILDRRLLIVMAAAAVIAAAAWVNVLDLQQSGAFSRDRRDLQSLGFGVSGALLCYLLLPRFDSRVFGGFAFTIYLYHVLGTSGARRLLHVMDVDNLGVHLVVGLAAGIGFPVLLHLSAMQHPVTSQLLLGQRRARSRHKVAAIPS